MLHLMETQFLVLWAIYILFSKREDQSTFSPAEKESPFLPATAVINFPIINQIMKIDHFQMYTEKLCISIFEKQWYHIFIICTRIFYYFYLITFIENYDLWPILQTRKFNMITFLFGPKVISLSSNKKFKMMAKK